MKELSERQETRLITHLESSFTTLHRHFETRHSPLSTLPSLPLYLQTLLSLHSIILSIPPVSSSASLRTAFHLQLISLLPTALASYPLLPPLAYLWKALDEFDQGLVKVLNGDSGDGSFRAGEMETGVRGTDRVRMESVVKDVRKTLRNVLGVRVLEEEEEEEQDDEGLVDFRAEVVVPFMVVDRTEENTPALTTDDDQSMEDEDDDDESEFEEVDVASNNNPDEEEIFSIHYQPPPSSATLDETESSNIVRPGFDPDEEYPAEEEEAEEVSMREGLEEDSDEGIRGHVEKVFQLARTRLNQFKETV